MTDATQGGPAKKKLGPLAWIGIGCGVLAVVGMVVVISGGIFVARKAKGFVEEVEADPTAGVAMAAETMVRLNPALELVESDRERGTMTIREKDSGKTVTVHYDDIAEGRLSFEGPDGQKVEMNGGAANGDGAAMTVTTEDGVTTLGVTGDAIDLPDWLPRYPGDVSEQTGYTTVTRDQHSGVYGFTTEDTREDVIEFWQEVMEDLELEVKRTEIGGQSLISLQGTAEDTEVGVTVVPEGNRVRASVTFRGPI